MRPQSQPEANRLKSVFAPVGSVTCWDYEAQPVTVAALLELIPGLRGTKAPYANVILDLSSPGTASTRLVFQLHTLAELVHQLQTLKEKMEEE